MSNAAAVVAPRRSARIGGGRRGLVRVGDGGDDDGADLRRRRCRRSRAPCSAAATAMSMTVSSAAGEAPADDAGALPDPLVGGVDRRSTTLGRSADDPRVAAPVAAGSPARMRGVRGRRSPSDESTGAAVRTGAVGAWRRRLSGRWLGGRCAGTSACRGGGVVGRRRRARSRAASRSSGVFSATLSTPGSARLARPARVPAGGSSIRPVTPRSRHGLHAQVPAHRVAHLVDEPVEHLAAVVHDRAVGVGQQGDAGVVRRDGRAQRRAGPRPRAPCARCGTRRRPAAG